MTKDKYDFIQDILNDKRLKDIHRERVLKLTSDEIKREKEFNLVMEERIIRLENSIDMNSEMSINDTNIEGDSEIQLSSEDDEVFVDYSDFSTNPSSPVWILWISFLA